jgi:hypothetical protein
MGHGPFTCVQPKPNGSCVSVGSVGDSLLRKRCSSACRCECSPGCKGDSLFLLSFVLFFFFPSILLAFALGQVEKSTRPGLETGKAGFTARRLKIPNLGYTGFGGQLS